LAEVEDVVDAGLAEHYILIADLGVLNEFGKSFIEPKGHPFEGIAELEVGVLVIDGRVGVLVFGVETEQNVVPVLGAEKQALEVYLTPGEINRRLERLKAFLVFDGDDDDGQRRVDPGLWEERLEEPAHALELVENVAALLVAGVGDDGEVGAADLEPLVGGSGRGSAEGRE